MIFSCLVDADFKDTEQFYAQVEGREVDRHWLALRSILPELIKAFDKHMAETQRADTLVNDLRAQILSHVRSRAAEPPGLFTLTVPTGGGKTLASLGFALDHARTWKHERIIYAIPFTAIIDQTAAIFRKVLGDDVVLEHHSAIEDDKYDPRNPPTGKDKLKLAMEDWAAPVVVTTNVQFFESLFAARTSRSRKLHNIAGSVIILDEAQTLPRPLLSPCAQALDELARNYSCTIILCTATQPALDARNSTPDIRRHWSWRIGNWRLIQKVWRRNWSASGSCMPVTWTMLPSSPRSQARIGGLSSSIRENTHSHSTGWRRTTSWKAWCTCPRGNMRRTGEIFLRECGRSSTTMRPAG